MTDDRDGGNGAGGGVLRGGERPDRAAIDEAVAGLNRIYLRRGIETARELGEFVLETFFAGDPANFRDRGRDHVSFRALAYRTDLRVSYTLVWRSVAVLEQLRVLPPEVAAQLSLSHHVELLPLPDPEVKLRLAHEAAAAGWSRRELREQVRRFRSEQPDPRRRGRPPLPGVIKGLRQLREGVQLATSEPLTYRNLRRIDLQEPLPRVVQQLDDCVAQLSELRQSMLESDFAAEKGLCRRKSTDQDDEE